VVTPAGLFLAIYFLSENPQRFCLLAGQTFQPGNRLINNSASLAHPAYLAPCPVRMTRTVWMQIRASSQIEKFFT
jgi:hypothetical protein